MSRGITLLLFLAALIFTVPTPAETFRNPVRISTSIDPNDVNVVDLNGDGTPDILWTAWGTLSTDPSTVHTLIGQPDGGFSVGPVLDLPSNVTTYCRAGDVTGDGKPDLVCPYVLGFSAALETFPGNGDGSFSTPIVTALPSSENSDVDWSPLLHPLIDFNSDGRADVLIADAATDVGYILLGQADGSFKLVDTIGSIGLPQALDINGDGHLDLLFPTSRQILLGDGTGKFSQNYNGVSVAGSCVYGKVNGEPYIDAVCGQELTTDGDITGGTQLLIFHGNGDGTFNPTPVKSTTYGDHTNQYNGFGTFLNPLAVIDLNGDGIPDIVAEAGDGLTVLLGQSGLDFTYPVHYATGYIPGSSAFGTVGEFALQIADLNGDGLPDLVSTGPNGVYLNYGRPDGTFDTAPAYEVTQVIGYQTVADFNEDGIPDAAATGDQAIELSLGNGDGSFRFRTPLPRGNADFSTPPSVANAHILHGDFNGDHHQDIIAVGSPSIYEYDNYIFFGHGDGSFANPALISDASLSYPSTGWTTVFDVNKDGRDDILTSDFGDLYFSVSEGNGSFTVVTTKIPTDYSPTKGAVQSLPVLADFDEDGKADALFGTGTSVYVLKGHGDGAFDSPGTKLSTPAYLSVQTQGTVAVAAGDFDGDGHQDIAVLAYTGISLVPPTDAYSTALFVYYGDGHGGFSAPTPITGFDRAYSGMQAADLNKDGLADLVFKTNGALGGGHAVGIVHSLAGRSFGPEINYDAGTGLADLSIADLNSDGFPDLVFGNDDSNIAASSVTVLMNLGNTLQVTGTLRASPEPSIEGETFQLIASLTAPNNSTLGGDISFSVDGTSVGSASLASNTATLPVSLVLAAGLHTIRADWPGNTSYEAVTLTADHQVVAGYPTSTSIVSSRNPSPFGAAVTFTVAVQSSNGTPPGSVSLADGSTVLATLPLADGRATYSISTLASGTHTITATYLPDIGWASSSGSLTQEIDRIDASSSLTASPNPVYAWHPVKVTATLSAASPTPTGTVTFDSNFSSIGAQTLTNGKAVFTTTFSAAGSYILSGEYSGDQNYNPGGFPLLSESVQINPTATRLSVASGSVAAFQPITLAATVSSTTTTSPSPSGTVTFLDGSRNLGSATLTDGTATFQTTALDAGTHTLSASYTGDPAFSPSTSTAVSLSVQKGPASVQLKSSLNPARFGSAVTFTAVVANARPNGSTVTFFDGSTQLGSAAAVDSSGDATLTSSTLAIGTHSITASYSGDGNLLPGTSSPLQQTILPPGDFTIKISPSSTSIYTGESAGFQIAIAATDGFNQPLALSCAGLPSSADCVFTPASLASGQGESSLVIETAAPQKTTATLRLGSGGAFLASIAIIFIPCRRRRRFRNSLLSLCLIAATFACLGCSNATQITGGTPPGTYPVTVTAVTTSGPLLSHTVTITLVVKSLF